MGDTTYTNWTKRLAGEKVMTYDGDPDVGFYRKPVRNKRKEGNQITGWERVAYFMDGAEMVCMIDGVELTADASKALWTYVCQYPVPEEVWRAVEGGGEWPRTGLLGEPKQAHRVAYPASSVTSGQDVANVIPGNTLKPGDRLELLPAADRMVTKTDNTPPVERKPEEVLSEQIANAIKTAPASIKTDAELATATNMRNRLNELKNDAERAKETEYRPLKNAADLIGKRYNPVITAAEAGATALRKLMQKYLDDKRAAAAEEARRVEEANRKIEEANERAIDRAIESGATLTDADLQAPVEATVQMPVRIEAGHGRAAAIRVVKIAQIDNEELVYRHFKGDAEITARLLTLCQRAIDNNLTIPGASYKEGTQIK